MPALLYSPDDRFKRRQRFTLGESEDIVLLLPWLIAFTRGGDSRQRDAAQNASEGKLERTLLTCSHAGGVKMTARDLLAELRSAGNEEMWNTLVAKFPSEDQAAVSVAADAALANATEGEDGNSPPWHPNDECFSVVIFDVISSSQAPETTVNDLLTCNSSSAPTSGRRSSEGE